MIRASHGSRPAWIREDHCRVDHQPVGERVGELAEGRLDVPAPREEAVHLVGDPGDPEDDRGGPRVATVAREDQRDEHGDQQEPRDRQRVRHLGAGHADRICPC